MPQTSTCVVYCRSWCADCRRAVRWLDDMGYEYSEIDVDEDAHARERCIELAGKVVTPIFEIGDTCIVDFDPRALRDALGNPEK